MISVEHFSIWCNSSYKRLSFEHTVLARLSIILKVPFLHVTGAKDLQGKYIPLLVSLQKSLVSNFQKLLIYKTFWNNILPICSISYVYLLFLWNLFKILMTFMIESGWIQGRRSQRGPRRAWAPRLFDYWYFLLLTIVKRN